MGHQILYLLMAIAVVTSKATPQPYEEEPVQNGTVCPTMFSPIGNKCLYFASFVQQSHVACRQVCHSLGGELAAIRTATELELIIEEIEHRGLHQMGFWIDGTLEGGYWNFTSGDLVPMGTPFWYATKTTKSPANDPLLSCASINADSGFLMKDVDCEVIFSPLCEHEPMALNQSEKDREEETDLETENISCPPFFVPISGNCIAFITWSQLAWLGAKQTCNAITTTGKLLVPTDIELLRTLYLYIHKEGLEGHDFWIGATDEVEEGKWVDDDKTLLEIHAPFWGNSDGPDHIMEPDGDELENCLALTSKGQHYVRDEICTNTYNPLCTADPLTQ